MFQSNYKKNNRFNTNHNNNNSSNNNHNNNNNDNHMKINKISKKFKKKSNKFIRFICLKLILKEIFKNHILKLKMTKINNYNILLKSNRNIIVK